MLHVSQEATKGVGQDITLVTFDLALAKKEYNLVWQHDVFKNVLVCLGSFPAVRSKLGAVERLMRGTGLTDLVIQSAASANGSVKTALTGKHVLHS